MRAAVITRVLFRLFFRELLSICVSGSATRRHGYDVSGREMMIRILICLLLEWGNDKAERGSHMILLTCTNSCGVRRMFAEETTDLLCFLVFLLPAVKKLVAVGPARWQRDPDAPKTSLPSATLEPLNLHVVVRFWCTDCANRTRA